MFLIYFEIFIYILNSIPSFSQSKLKQWDGLVFFGLSVISLFCLGYFNFICGLMGFNLY